VAGFTAEIYDIGLSDASVDPVAGSVLRRYQAISLIAFVQPLPGEAEELAAVALCRNSEFTCATLAAPRMGQRRNHPVMCRRLTLGDAGLPQ
jgi:hypothetical protein